MKTYKFTTKISDKGIIQIPFDPKLFNKVVEVVITPAPKQGKVKNNAVDFVNKWAGFLKEENTDQSKYEYISDKFIIN